MTLRGHGRGGAASPAEAPPSRRAGGSPSATATFTGGGRHRPAHRASGECFGFLGPNGAGKTTTMRMLSCLAPAGPRGACEVLGLDPDREPRRLKRMLGVVAQDTTLDLELTVRENLLVYARYFDDPAGRGARRRADELLGLMALDDRADDDGGAALGRHAAAPPDRPRPDQPPPPGAAGRAHDGPRPPGPPRRVGAAAAAARRRRDARDDHPLHGRGGPALRPAGDHGPRPHRARREPRRPRGGGGGPRGAGAAGGPGRRRRLLAAPRRARAATRWTATCWCCSPTTPRPSTRAARAAGRADPRSRPPAPAGLEDVFLRLTGRRLRD